MCADVVSCGDVLLCTSFVSHVCGVLVLLGSAVRVYVVAGLHGSLSCAARCTCYPRSRVIQYDVSVSVTWCWYTTSEH